MTRRLLAVAAAGLIGVTALTGCFVPAPVTQPLAVTWRDIAHGVVAVFSSRPAMPTVVDPRSGKNIDCSVLLHYPDKAPLRAPTGSGYETHAEFVPWRTDPTTWNTFCHGLRSITIVKITGTNSPTILGSAYVPVALHAMRLAWTLALPRWVGDAYISGKFDVIDYLDNYLIGYGA